VTTASVVVIAIRGATLFAVSAGTWWYRGQSGCVLLRHDGSAANLSLA